MRQKLIDIAFYLTP